MQVSEKSYTESPLIYLQEPLEETRNKTNAYVLQTGFANTCTPPQTKLTPSKRHPGIDNQNNLLEIFHTIELARQFAHQKEWDAAHRTLSTIQDPFWRDSGYSSCARLQLMQQLLPHSRRLKISSIAFAIKSITLKRK